MAARLSGCPGERTSDEPLQRMLIVLSLRQTKRPRVSVLRRGESRAERVLVTRPATYEPSPVACAWIGARCRRLRGERGDAYERNGLGGEQPGGERLRAERLCTERRGTGQLRTERRSGRSNDGGRSRRRRLES